MSIGTANFVIAFLAITIGLVTPEESSTTASICGEHEELKPCPKSCGTNCTDVYLLDTCYDICWNEPQCQCADGYAHSETIKKCVLIEDCPTNEIKCPPNQKYTICKTQNPCKPGCICQPGFKLDVPTGQCYSGSALCPDPNSYWDTCSNSCSHRTCSTLDEPMWCADVTRCTANCSCTGDFIFNEKTGKCGTEADCKID